MGFPPFVKQPLTVLECVCVCEVRMLSKRSAVPLGKNWIVFWQLVAHSSWGKKMGKLGGGLPGKYPMANAQMPPMASVQGTFGKEKLH